MLHIFSVFFLFALFFLHSCLQWWTLTKRETRWKKMLKKGWMKNKSMKYVGGDSKCFQAGDNNIKQNIQQRLNWIPLFRLPKGGMFRMNRWKLMYLNISEKSLAHNYYSQSVMIIYDLLDWQRTSDVKILNWLRKLKAHDAFIYNADKQKFGKMNEKWVDCPLLCLGFAYRNKER